MDPLEGYFIFDELGGIHKQCNLFPYSPCEDYPLVLGSYQIFQQVLSESGQSEQVNIEI